MNVRPMGLSIDSTSMTLGVSKSTVWRMIKKGELTTFKIGRRRLVTTASVERIVDENAA